MKKSTDVIIWIYLAAFMLLIPIVYAESSGGSGSGTGDGGGGSGTGYTVMTVNNLTFAAVDDKKAASDSVDCGTYPDCKKSTCYNGKTWTCKKDDAARICSATSSIDGCPE